MQRRTTAILLIGFGLIVIIAVLAWLFWPSINTPKAPVEQPPAYPTGQATDPVIDQTAPIVRVPTTPAGQASLRIEERLRRTAQDFVSRAGSYSNTDGFNAVRQAGLGTAPAVQAYLNSEQVRLANLYPITGGSWGQTALGLASRVTTPTPIGTQTSVVVQVDAQIITEVGLQPSVKDYRQANVTFQKAGEDWAISRLEWTGPAETE